MVKRPVNTSFKLMPHFRIGLRANRVWGPSTRQLSPGPLLSEKPPSSGSSFEVIAGDSINEGPVSSHSRPDSAADDSINENPLLTGFRTEFFAAAADSDEKHVSSRGSSSAAQSANVHDIILRRLEQLVSTIAARSIMKHVCNETKVFPEVLAWRHLDKVVPLLEKRLNMYGKEEGAIQEIIRDIRRYANVEPSPENVVVQQKSGLAEREKVHIVRENDIKLVRQIARTMAEEMGMSSFKVQRLVTVASELARNIYHYAQPGSVELRRFTTEDMKGIKIIARDNGPGIPNLDEVLSKEYDSKTGLGKGLSGTKNLMTTFEIQTYEGVGTTITTTLEVPKSPINRRRLESRHATP